MPAPKPSASGSIAVDGATRQALSEKHSQMRALRLTNADSEMSALPVRVRAAASAQKKAKKTQIF
jgi:hypothetical protein